MAQMIKYLPAMQETQVRSLNWEHPLEKGMATHSSILAWKNPMDREVWQASPQGHKESDRTEQLTLSLSLVTLFQIPPTSDII